MWCGLAPHCVFLSTLSPQSHPSSINLRDGHLGKAPVFAVTTLELVLRVLLAEGLKSPLYTTRMGSEIPLRRLQVLHCVESHVCGTHGDITEVCHAPSINGVWCADDMQELSAWGTLPGLCGH